MPIITFISDFGRTDHYVASVEASILKYNPNNNIVNISHQIKKYDLSHAAYVFKNVYKEFPKGSVHIIAVNNSDARPSRFVGGERIDAAISELNFEKRKVNLSIKLLEELQNKEAVSKFSSPLSGNNLPFSSLSDKLDDKKKDKK